MGSLCDTNDIDRFMRSEAGRNHLAGIVTMLKGKTVVDVDFTSEASCIATTLHLDDGESFVILQPSLDVETLREQFAETLEEEYYADYPERPPKDEG